MDVFFAFRKVCTIVHIEGGLKMSVFTGKKLKGSYVQMMMHCIGIVDQRKGV